MGETLLCSSPLLSGGGGYRSGTNQIDALQLSHMTNFHLHWRLSTTKLVAYHAQCCKGLGNYPAIGTPSVVYIVHGRCNVLNDASRTNQQEFEIGNTIVK